MAYFTSIIVSDWILIYLDKIRINRSNMGTTMCIVHAGFNGFRVFVARKKSRCNLTGNHLVIPHDTIH